MASPLSSVAVAMIYHKKAAGTKAAINLEPWSLVVFFLDMELLIGLTSNG